MMKKQTKTQNKKKRIALELQKSVISGITAIFLAMCVAVAVMIGSISMSAQQNDLQMQSRAASYQLETFFQEYMTIVEQVALDTDVRALLAETTAGDDITQAAK